MPLLWSQIRRYAVNDLHLTAIGFAYNIFQLKKDKIDCQALLTSFGALQINFSHGEDYGRRIRRSRKTHRTGSIIKSRASSDPEGVGEAEVVCKAQRLRKAANDVKNSWPF